MLGRKGIHAFHALASTHTLKIKFPTKNGIEMEKEDQKLDRSCYIAALRADRIGVKSSPLKTWMSENKEYKSISIMSTKLLIEPS